MFICIFEATGRSYYILDRVAVHVCFWSTQFLLEDSVSVGYAYIQCFNDILTMSNKPLHKLVQDTHGQVLSLRHCKVSASSIVIYEIIVWLDPDIPHTRMQLCILMHNYRLR